MGVSNARLQTVSTSEDSSKQERLGGARADFVANLGRRKSELTSALETLRHNPTESRERDELRRRLHALGAGAKLLRFSRLAEAIKEVEDLLTQAALRGEVSATDVDAVESLLSRATELAWAQTGGSNKIAARPVADDLRQVVAAAAARTLVSALILGPRYLGEALGGEAEVLEGNVFDVEQTMDMEGAVDLARVVAPDLIVLDVDLPGATDVIEGLSEDALTEAIPVIAVGRFRKQDDVGRLAALGVAKSLLKPLSPTELRRVANQVLSSYVKREIVRQPYGNVALRELAGRLAEELQRGISDAANNAQITVDYGEGNELSAAVWSAVARIRDVVTIKSRGEIRYSLGGPEGAMPVSWQEGSDTLLSARSGSNRARGCDDVSLEGTTIVLADDDPATVWFLAGVLKSAGARVFEARDGERALEIAKHRDPDLVVSDILMPKLDGFGLCRAIKRDVLMRDVPVILLSWKEDLLQRMRELGADADGYMRKEASAGAFVQRIRELLRQKKRASARIATGGQVRGRLDGLTAYCLLKIACLARRDCSLTIRDANFLYEVEVRDGRPVRATRTTTTGRFDRGPSVMAALLGTGDGRFVVSAVGEQDSPLKADLSGTLTEQLMPVVATARAAQGLLSGANLVRTRRVSFDSDALATYLEVMPPNMRCLLIELANGTSPRTLISKGKQEAHLVECVLRDAANQSLVCEVVDGDDVDRLPQAIAKEITILRGDNSSEPVGVITILPELDHTPMPAPPLEIQMPTGSEVLAMALESQPKTNHAKESEHAEFAEQPIEQELLEPAEESLHCETLERVPTRAEPRIEVAADGAPSGEEGASTLSDPWFFETPAVGRALPSSGERLTPAASTIAKDIWSVTPAAEAANPPYAQEVRGPLADSRETLRTPTPTPSKLPPPPGLVPMLSLGSLHPPPVLEERKREVTPAPKHTRKERTPTPTPINTRKRTHHTDRELTPSSPFVDRRRIPLPSSYYIPAPKKDKKALLWIAFAACGIAFALWARWSRERTRVSEDVLTANVIPAAEATPPAPAGTEQPAAATEAPAALPAGRDEPEVLPVRDSEKLKKGQGMLEVVAGKSDTIFIDGKPMGSGPLVSVALKAKDDPYEIKVRLRDEDRVRRVAVKEGKLTRVRVAPPWSR